MLRLQSDFDEYNYIFVYTRQIIFYFLVFFKLTTSNPGIAIYLKLNR